MELFIYLFIFGLVPTPEALLYTWQVIKEKVEGDRKDGRDGGEEASLIS